MALDRILPLKIESPTSGGTQEDAFPTDVNHNEDYADLRGIVFQDDSSDDELVYASRDASGNMTFTDIVTGTTYTLSQLAAASIPGHPFKVDSGESLTIPQNFQFDHLGRFPIDGRKIINGRFVLGIGAVNG